MTQEELGTGIRKVYKYIHAYTGNDLVTFEEDDLFRVKISLGSLFPDPNANGILNGTLNNGQQKDRWLLASNQTLTKSHLPGLIPKPLG